MVTYFLCLLLITLTTRLHTSSAFQSTSSSSIRSINLKSPLLFSATPSTVDHEVTTPTRSKMKILGICGGIGSGKSTACQVMVDKLGCVARIDADKLAHCVYEPGSQSLQEIVEEFGNNILLSKDSSADDVAEIDRQKLGAIVFNDPSAMSKLEQIVWPHVRSKIEERISEITTECQSAESENEIIIVEAALLLETDWHDLLDGLWVVQASPSVAVKRLMENRGLTEEDALVRIHAQQKRSSLLSKTEDESISGDLRQEMEKGIVTAVVTNDGTMDDLEEALKKALCDDAAFKKAACR